MSKHDITELLKAHLNTVAAEHEKRHNDPERQHAIMQLAQWQSNRLLETYSDLVAQPRYREAMLFFKEDMYAPKDFSKRDSEAQKVIPMMVRIVPSNMVETLESVMELNALTMQLDDQLAMAIKGLGHIEHITAEHYAEGYRVCDNYDTRVHQIELLVKLGQAVSKYVTMPYIATTLKMMGGPASMMGLSALHEFFKRGYGGFKKIGDTDAFLSEIQFREMQILNNVFANKEAPFCVGTHEIRDA